MWRSRVEVVEERLILPGSFLLLRLFYLESFVLKLRSIVDATSPRRMTINMHKRIHIAAVFPFMESLLSFSSFFRDDNRSCRVTIIVLTEYEYPVRTTLSNSVF